MEELSTIFGNVGFLVAAIAGGLSVVLFGFAGISYMTAQGDPQGMSRAKMSVIGAVAGLAIAGLAFVIPGIISRIIIEPAGGQRIVSDPGTDCDQLLKNQLVFQRTASTAARMQEVVAQIQAKYNDCGYDSWDPRVNTWTANYPDRCFHAADLALVEQLGGITIPKGLKEMGSLGNDVVRNHSGRDSANNILVYWDHSASVADPSLRPADGSLCWMYVSRLRTWAHGN